MSKRKKVLEDVLWVFQDHQAYDETHVILPADFKNIKHTTRDIVTMLGNLIANDIVVCDDKKQMYLKKPALQHYYSRTKIKMIVMYIVCGLISLSLFLLLL